MKKVILITGVSSGFGKSTSKILAEKGHTVYGTIRQQTDPRDNVNLIIMDLTDPGSIIAAVETVFKNEGRIDILINNAGMRCAGPVETTPENYVRLQMDTNFLGMVRITREVIPHMRKQNSGMIINISSIGGLMGLPFQAYYSASKFAIEGFSEALRMETKQFNIKVVVINPGDFQTNNTLSRRNFLAPTGKNDPYYEKYNKTLAKIEKAEIEGWDAEILAQRIARIVDLQNPSQHYIIGPFTQKIAVVLKKLMPGSAFRKLIMEYYYEIN
jgi:NAD(P)-dependent dehydrogenase (short-subunit alcohol dehydrogenase family)